MLGSRFDAYTATTRAARSGDLLGILEQFRGGGERMRQGRAYHGFERKVALTTDGGSEWASVLWGGTHGDLVMVEAKGERTPHVVKALRSWCPAHRCTRVDSCADVDEPGAWDRLHQVALDVKARRGLRGERRGDWDFPEDGRTQYLGSASSAVRVRLYEKGKEPELRHLGRFDLVRLEVQVRPVRAARELYSGLDAVEVWGASAFTRELAARLLELDVAPAPAGWLSKGSQRDIALGFAAEQYGRHFESLAEELGDWQCVGLQLRDMIAERRRLRRRRCGRS
jgi:hypothetical protein